jgi:ApaG protein
MVARATIAAVASPMTRSNGRLALYHAMTDGFRVSVRPQYLPEQSDPLEPRHVFAYHIRIENLSEVTAQLLWRHWHIHDDVAGPSEVEGEGVVGRQPVLAPGDVHEYNSFCVLRGGAGHMVGSYRFRTEDGRDFEVAVPRFELRVPGAGAEA